MPIMMILRGEKNKKIKNTPAEAKLSYTAWKKFASKLYAEH